METHIRALATWARMDRQRIGALIRARREALRLTVRAAADLVPDRDGPAELLDRLASIVDQIDDTGVEALLSQVEVYERQARLARA